MDLRRDWRTQAACREMGPDVFFPNAHGNALNHPAQEERAKRICGGCPVREECLDFALANREEFGIWGGLTEKERRSLRRRMRKETA